MALSAFDDKAKPPGQDELKRVLGRSSPHWTTLRNHAAQAFAPLEEIWSFSGAKYGWSLRLRQKKRVVLYMTPCTGHFLVGVALGEKAVQAAHAAPLPDWLLALIDAAPKYAEGRGVRIEVRTKAQLHAVQALAAIKMST